jgi:5-methylcytosine-specific restriction enzyme B
MTETHDWDLAAKEFVYSPEEERAAGQLRIEFIKKFPREQLQNLSLQNYALGLEPRENSLCYWLEFKTRELGKISGTPALQHVVFFNKKRNQWKFDKKYRNETEAFTAAKKGILDFLSLAEHGQLNKIEFVEPFKGRNLTRGKLLFLYFPDKFLPIYNISSLRDACGELNILCNTESQVEMQQHLLDFKANTPAFAQWSNLRFGKFLYAHFDLKKQFWKVAPGDKAKLWDECRDGGYICIGWDELGDIEEFEDKDEFKERFLSIWPKNKRKWREVWQFAHDIREGDIILANNGITSLVGIGKVTRKYFFSDQRNEYKHCIGVYWEDARERSLEEFSKTITADWPFCTVKKLTREEYRELTSLRGTSPGLLWGRQNNYELKLQNPEALNMETGKNLAATFFATAPQEGGIHRELRAGIEDWLNNPKIALDSSALVLLSNWFTSDATHSKSPTGHAAGHLWDFLFRCRPKSRMSTPARNDVILPEAFEDWWAEQQRLQGQVSKLPIPDRVSSFFEICARTYLSESFFRDCEQLLRSKKQMILQGAPGTGKTFIAKQLARFWAGSQNRVLTVQFHESYGYEDFVFGIKPISTDNGGATFKPEHGTFVKFCDVARHSKEPHVLVIDEINRGKTSRVFGELLYLLEYRTESIKLQSGLEFSIPDNLYIIATMNTVDKSIALVDYALRRRFAFVTLHPVSNGRSTVLGNWMRKHNIKNADDIEKLFVTLNQEIAKRDEALMIGHSYFMSEEARAQGEFTQDMLEFVWRYHILPLVAEYEYQMKGSELIEKYGLHAIKRKASPGPEHDGTSFDN